MGELEELLYLKKRLKEDYKNKTINVKEYRAGMVLLGKKISVLQPFKKVSRAEFVYRCHKELGLSFKNIATHTKSNLNMIEKLYKEHEDELLFEEFKKQRRGE